MSRQMAIRAKQAGEPRRIIVEEAEYQKGEVATRGRYGGEESVVDEHEHFFDDRLGNLLCG